MAAISAAGAADAKVLKDRKKTRSERFERGSVTERKVR